LFLLLTLALLVYAARREVLRWNRNRIGAGEGG
jgi:hypothetical protein